jgi:MFS family permease
LVGAPLGGVLFGLAGFTTLVWVDVASYLVSGAAILMTTRLPSGRLERGGGIRVVLAELGEGMTFLRGERTASALLLVTTLFLAGNASLTALLVPFGVRELGGSVQTGLVMSALGVGFLLGAPVIRILVDRVQPGYLLCASLTATAIGFLLLFASRSMLSAVLAAVVIGVFGSMVLVTAQTTVQRVTPNEVLGRISAAFFTGEAIATFLGALAGPAIAQSSSLAAAAYVACAATLLSGVLSLVLVPRRPTLSQTAEPPVDGGHRSRKGGCLAAVGR